MSESDLYWFGCVVIKLPPFHADPAECRLEGPVKLILHLPLPAGLLPRVKELTVASPHAGHGTEEVPVGSRTANTGEEGSLAKKVQVHGVQHHQQKIPTNTTMHNHGTIWGKDKRN